MIYDHDLQFETANQFLEALLSENSFKPSGFFGATEAGLNGYLFRGQADWEWPLLPRVHRSPNELPKFTPQPPDARDLEKGRYRHYLGAHLHAELRAVHLFLEQADKLGIATPLDYSKLRLHADLMNAAMNGEDFDYDSPFPDVAVWPALAFAQHHGVPTRVLDWTESILVAAYFAAADFLNEVPGDAVSKMIAVHCLDARWLRHREDADVVKVTVPRHANSFLRAQKGIFTLIPRANSYFLQHCRWPSIEDVVKDWRERHPHTHMVRPPFIRYSVPAAEAGDLLRLLWSYDITRHHLMPSLANAAEAFMYVKTLWPKPLASARIAAASTES